MKRVQLKPVKFYGLLMIVLIAIVIFEPSCQEETEFRPSAKFILKGKVLLAEDTLPLKDIQVIMLLDTFGIDTAITDQNGSFEVSDSMGIPAEIAYTIKFTDELKSSDERIDISLTYKFTDLTFTNGDGQWYLGETIKDSTFMLEYKND